MQGWGLQPGGTQGWPEATEQKPQGELRAQRGKAKPESQPERPLAPAVPAISSGDPWAPANPSIRKSDWGHGGLGDGRGGVTANGYTFAFRVTEVVVAQDG